jgi:hypothetical protein
MWLHRNIVQAVDEKDLKKIKMRIKRETPKKKKKWGY